MRDLWALRVSLLKDLVAAPLEMARRQSKHREHTDDEDEKEDMKEDDKEDKDYKEDDDDLHSDDALQDPDEMLENAHSDDEDAQPQTMEEALEAASRVKTSRRIQSAVDEFNMIWLLAVLSLGFWTLRLPVFYLDFKT